MLLPQRTASLPSKVVAVPVKGRRSGEILVADAPTFSVGVASVG
jgi:hypothetical protein